MRRIVATLAVTLLAQLPAAATTSKEAVVAEIRSVFGAASSRALRVAHCESRFIPSAIHHNRNGTRDYGIFQLNDGGTLQSLGLTRATALDYRANIRAAYRLYRRAGWRPWVC